MVFDENTPFKGMSDEEICARCENPEFWIECEKRELELYSHDIPKFVKIIKKAIATVIKELQGLKDSTGIFAINIYGYTFDTTTISDANGLKEELKKSLALQLDFLKEKSRKDYEAILKFIDKTVSNTISPCPYTFNGNAIEALGRTRTIGKFDKMSSTFTVKGVNIFLPDITKTLGVGTAKIARYAISEFTKRHHKNSPTGKINHTVFLDLNAYAQANGVDINSDDAIKNFRRKLKGDLQKLITAGFTWTEKIKGKPRSYGAMNYFSKYEVKNGTITISFTPDMTQYLVQLPVIPYPLSIFGIEDRDANAFAIGETMLIHYGINSNVVRGNYCKLRVDTLLQYTSYPSYEELQAHRHSWIDKIKEPFEQCLDRLYQCGFLSDWKYCYEGGIEIPDEEAGNIKSYREFISLLIVYELNGYETPQQRLKAIEEKKAENIKKLKSRNRKKKKDGE